MWPEIKSPVLAVNYLDLAARRRLHSESLNKGIKDALQFKGTCIAVIVGSNWRLHKLSIKDCVEEIESMGFDASTTIDDYVYRDDDSAFSWDRVQHTLDKADEMIRLDPSFPIIGLVKGASGDQVRFCVDRLEDFGLKYMAFPCSELIAERNYVEILSFMRHTRMKGIWGWLIGLGSPRLIRRFAPDCSSTSKWVWAATMGWALTPEGQKLSGHPSLCNYDLCHQLSKDGASDLKILAHHNFKTLLDLGLNLSGGMDLRQWK